MTEEPKQCCSLQVAPSPRLMYLTTEQQQLAVRYLYRWSKLAKTSSMPVHQQASVLEMVALQEVERLLLKQMRPALD